MNFVCYNEDELKRIHKTFVHPSVAALTSLLKMASTPDHLDDKTRQDLEAIRVSCNTFKQPAENPRRFKPTIGTERFLFNSFVQVYTMFINVRVVVHMIHEAKHFMAAAFLRDQSTSEIWKTMQRLWTHVYLGPGYLTVDQGSAYVSTEMRETLEAADIVFREEPIENPGSIGTVERYHAPLRAAFEQIKTDLENNVTDDDCLRSATFAVNSSVGPEDLCPTLLVFGAVPRPAGRSPSPTQIERGIAIEKAIEVVENVQAKRRIDVILEHPSGPKTGKSSQHLASLPIGSSVLVWRA